MPKPETLNSKLQKMGSLRVQGWDVSPYTNSPSKHPRLSSLYELLVQGGTSEVQGPINLVTGLIGPAIECLLPKTLRKKAQNAVRLAILPFLVSARLKGRR